MTTFEERGKALETKFFNDEELNFKATSRRRKLLGLWAAEYMHLNDEQTLEYALDIVKYGIENNEDGAVINKIINDIKNEGLDISEETIRLKMAELHKQALIELEKQFQEGAA